MDDAVATVMLQCELWTDNNDMEHQEVYYILPTEGKVQDFQMAADRSDLYRIKKD